ncbi:hypothetical protein [Nocardioides soli]|uniref:FtsH-binding integral membrane protein n=1 Tax=Nocardioides soli TaxID=1036020 RepID=A0A7W4VVB8_9ACTN|nr:hypothetical protein [Nocardioides soli]MBB3042178.1 FtsH-binding integral membrane protein [Nocardioides soli]
MRTPAALVGLLGGLAWLGSLALARNDRTGLAEVVEWVGLALLLAAAVAAGAGLVSRSTRWLRVTVGVCFALLVWCLVQLVAGSGDERLAHAGLGLFAVVVASIVMARRPHPAPAAGGHRARGAHAR